MKRESLPLQSILISGLLLVSCCSCEEQETHVDPTKRILGKWETVQHGNWGNMHQVESSGFSEFREDSVVLYFDYDSQSYTYQAKYWLDDGLLIEMHTGTDGQSQLLRRRYEFMANRLRLDHIDFLMQFDTSVLQKVR